MNYHLFRTLYNKPKYFSALALIINLSLFLYLLHFAHSLELFILLLFSVYNNLFHFGHLNYHKITLVFCIKVLFSKWTFFFFCKNNKFKPRKKIIFFYLFIWIQKLPFSFSLLLIILNIWFFLKEYSFILLQLCHPL